MSEGSEYREAVVCGEVSEGCQSTDERSCTPQLEGVETRGQCTGLISDPSDAPLRPRCEGGVKMSMGAKRGQPESKGSFEGVRRVNGVKLTPIGEGSALTPPRKALWTPTPDGKSETA